MRLHVPDGGAKWNIYLDVNMNTFVWYGMLGWEPYLIVGRDKRSCSGPYKLKDVTQAWNLSTSVCTICPPIRGLSYT